jgi:hypothetical protein
MGITFQFASRSSVATRVEVERTGHLALYENASANGDPPLCFVKKFLNAPASNNDPSNYRVALFTHRRWPEAQVLSMKQGNANIGLAFSMTALASEAGTLTGKRMWNDYGHVALVKLCLGDHHGSPRVFRCEEAEQYGIDEMYDEDTVVVVLIADQCGLSGTGAQEFAQFLHARVPSFARLDLFLQEDKGSSGVRDYDMNEDLKALSREGRSIPIDAISADFPSSAAAFLDDLLVRTDPYEDHPAFRFFLYYQVIECLLHDVFDRYHSAFATTASLPTYANVVALRDLIEKLQHSITEKTRLARIIEANGHLGSEFQELHRQCNGFLNAAGIAPESGVAAALYRVRNVIFHSFNRVSGITGATVPLTEFMQQFVCDLALSYKSPAVQFP